MTTETLTNKATRLLTKGRVQVIWATDQAISARARGDSGGIWDIHWSRLLGWSCTCPAYGECSHVRAVANVTTRNVRRPDLAIQQEGQ